MKKLMVLGGNISQLQLIHAAHKENYQVILIDYTTTNPGIALADVHYQVNYMDMEKVLEIARKEQIDGVISNSEYAMQTVAYVAEHLHLVGNSLNSVNSLIGKPEFRELQHKNGIYAPAFCLTNSYEEACEEAKKMQFPVMLKPCRSSASKGAAKIETLDDFGRSEDIWMECSRYSTNSQVILEEYIDMPSLSVIECEAFIHKEQLLLGLYMTRRNEKRPLVAVSYDAPARFSEEEMAEIHELLMKTFKAAGIQHGEYNAELYYTREHRLFLIEINARQGGDNLPYVVERAEGYDMTRMLVTTAVGDDAYFDEVMGNPRKEIHYFTRYIVYPRKSGIFKGIHIEEEARKYLDKTDIWAQAGSSREMYRNAQESLAYVDFLYPSYEKQIEMEAKLDQMVYAEMEEI